MTGLLLEWAYVEKCPVDGISGISIRRQSSDLLNPSTHWFDMKSS